MEAHLYPVIHSWFYNQHKLRVQIVKEQLAPAKLKVDQGAAALYFELFGRRF